MGVGELGVRGQLVLKGVIKLHEKVLFVVEETGKNVGMLI